MGYIDVWEHYGDDRYPSNEDLYSPELDFMDTCVASVSFLLSDRILVYVSRLGYNHLAFKTFLFSLLACEPPYP